ncbi:glutathione S-transferase [Neptuniibacter sp.]|uniref:glutathione S-transferase n=1 Tax=Neptuniibacter sp. TaxID=1962643 RepID=UPI002602AD1D|nr:glutathione S-transferase [Neptuniibacter sp.]MCP4596880.1 glutathione S-transferase [Neptuniibacter sp.]
MTQELPVLYSFRRCPYAMRARLAITVSTTQVELREVVLKNKPEEMLVASPKGTVPVLVLPDGKVIDESLDIMRWALGNSDPDNLLRNASPEKQLTIAELIEENDHIFKQHLDRYKYFDRFPELPQSYYREQAEVTLLKLEQQLQQHNYLVGSECSLADLAIFPFIRQFAHVDKQWFDTAPYPALQKWLGYFLESKLFNSIMKKYPQWNNGDQPLLFPEQ